MASSSNQQADKILNVNAEIMKHVTFNVNNATANTSTVNIDYCPAPVSTFLGRSEELVALKTLLTKHQMVALVGMGGLGKTQLSRKYVQVNKADYQYKYWLESETPEKLKNSFKKFAKRLHVESDNIDEEVVNDVYKKIEAVPTILVFDNVEKPADVYAYLPTRVDLPPGVTIHVLVTSRWTEWTCDKQIECRKLEPMDISASLQIFQRKFGETCIDTMLDEWKQLARMLGYLPLALQVATSYICKRSKHNSDLRTVLADYMKQLKEGAAGLLNDPLTEYGNRSIYASMMLILKQLENKANSVSNVQNDVQFKFAVTIINIVAYMDPDRIYKEDLLKLVDNPENICKLDEALAILTEYSLLNQRVGWKGATIYSVHRIIQTSIRHNQTLIGTADKYYIRVFKCAVTEYYYFPWDVTHYANERASTIADYYKNNPSPRILEYLAENKAIKAMEAVLKLLSKNQIQIAMKKHELLHLAVENGDLSMTQLLWKYGADINQLCREGAGEPPLHHALQSENMDIATWLLENGAAPSVRDRTGRTALHVAVKYENHKMVPIIIKTDRAVVNETDNYDRTPLHVINYSDNEKDILSTTRALVYSGADITAVDKDGNTVLHSASSRACAAAVSLILQQNKDLINIVNEDGETALHVIPYDDTDIDDERILSTIRVLVGSGADIAAVDKYGNTVLHSASSRACAAAVSLILQQNKDLINIVNEDGETALHVIPCNDRDIDDERILSTVRVLVGSGGDLTKVVVEGYTVLHLAAQYACAETVSLILQLNNDLINIVNEDGETALHVIPYYKYADEERILSTISVLVSGGGDLTKVDKWGNTVFHLAAKGACAMAVSLILQLNKDLVNIKNKDGQTALHVVGNNFSFEFEYEPEDRSEQLFAETARVLIMNGLSLDTGDNKGHTPLDTVQPEYKDTLLQVAGECNDQLLVRPSETLEN